MAATIACAALPAAARGRTDAVARALAAAGGEATLRRVRAISWIGTMRMLLGGVAVDLAVEARIEPFGRARFESWLPSDGRATRRTVMIERDGGFVVHAGAQTALSLEQARFQRQQAGAYAYLLLAPAYLSAANGSTLNASSDGYPPISLTLARDGRVAAADYRIASPDPDGAAVRQRLSFSGTVASAGVRFPRSISVMQNGRPFSRLTITDFAAELDPA
ncbi:hypothetical protein AB5I39_00150 [Sphingomonas sp. MMS24-J45]|uniref:hypothetical protein n=1 Tax=Sphingomonas sp. MMS24-J45 TaxID=3238806 RepID=UPI00385173BB